MSGKARVYLAIMVLVVSLVASMVSCGGDDDDDDDDGPRGDVWQDGNTGLNWQVQPTGDLMTWQEAVDYCQSLELGGNNGWDLPNIDQLRTIIQGCPETETGGECAMVDGCLDCWTDACEACEGNWNGTMDNCRFTDDLAGGCEDWYWSSSEDETDAEKAGAVDFFDALLTAPVKTREFLVRCVRD